MSDRIPALIAFALFVAFFAILLGSVKIVDLTIIVLICIGLVAYDMWRQVGPGRK